MPFVSYLRLAYANPRFLGFGFTMTFAASVGQTVFIGTFSPAIRADFDLTHTGWSAIYMAGTLASAVIFPWTGQQIDRMPLRRYTVWACFGLVFACAFAALVPSAVWLVLAIFLLRQTGQGLASHTGKTAVARRFHFDRGKALALTSLGDGVGKAILPYLAVLSIAAIGWRATYGVAAAVIAVFILPLAWRLLKPGGSESIDRSDPAERRARDQADGSSWSRKQVLRDVRFYLMLPAVLAPAFVSTALFFHNLQIAEVKGWSAAWMTGSYWIYAGGTVFASLAVGPLIDRLTAARVLPAFLLPMVLGLLIVWAFESRYWVLPYLLLVGLTSGISHTAVMSFWAEAYGVRHLGGIRSLAFSLMVFSTALGPLFMGVLMDWRMPVETICLLMAAYCIAATALMLVGLNGYKSRAAAPPT
ncbi:MAG: MFS transporter [Alphaproteobacteria bacterium]|nr:MFS transporter [Alphaproteobacteria bacterium]